MPGTPGNGAFDIPLTFVTDVRDGASLPCEPAREAVLSWNSLTDRGALEFRLLRAGQPATAWLPHMQWSGDGRQSHSPASGDVTVEVDVIHSTLPFDGIEVRAPGVEFDGLALATPCALRPSEAYCGKANVLNVPARSQYAVEGERGWCSPTSLSMLHAYAGVDRSVADTARAVFDRAYNGTGNWSFNVAFSGRLGLRAAVVYLRNLDHAQRFIEAGIPLALSYSWQGDELPGAPLEHSDGHLAVLCGFTDDGDCAMNDPAAPALRVTYPRSALERVWQRNRGVAFAAAPSGDFLSLVNG
ncbi:MAG: C39 family peptidase [Candidatus Eremiobacteraeota bacterium]|nr:C39 family peptidase [Candidatus Eremiobacteraeota bacterium]